MKLDELMSSSQSTQIVYEKSEERKIIKIYSLDEHGLINGLAEFNINDTSKLAKQIARKGFRLISSEDYLYNY